LLSPGLAHFSCFFSNSVDTAQEGCLFLFFESIFQGAGRGMTSLMLSVIRQVLLVAVFAYLLAVTLGLGEAGVWWGVVAGDIGGSLVAYCGPDSSSGGSGGTLSDTSSWAAGGLSFCSGCGTDPPYILYSSRLPGALNNCSE